MMPLHGLQPCAYFESIRAHTNLQITHEMCLSVFVRDYLMSHFTCMSYFPCRSCMQAVGEAGQIVPFARQPSGNGKLLAELSPTTPAASVDDTPPPLDGEDAIAAIEKMAAAGMDDADAKMSSKDAKAESKGKTTGKCAPKAKGKAKAKAKGKAKAKATAKHVAKDKHPAPAGPKKMKLGCSKCRYAKKGCAVCRNPAFKGTRGK